MKKILFIPIWLFFLICFIGISKLYLADVYSRKAVNLALAGNLQEAEYFGEKAVLFNKSEPKYLINLAKVKVLNLYESNDSFYGNEIVNLVEKAILLNPHNLVTKKNIIPIYYYVVARDPNYISRFTDFLRKTKEEYPNDVGVITLVAKYEKLLGLFDDYFKSITAVKKLRPDLLDWHDSFR